MAQLYTLKNLCQWYARPSQTDATKTLGRRDYHVGQMRYRSVIEDTRKHYR